MRGDHINIIPDDLPDGSIQIFSLQDIYDVNGEGYSLYCIKWAFK